MRYYKCSVSMAGGNNNFTNKTISTLLTMNIAVSGFVILYQVQLKEVIYNLCWQPLIYYSRILMTMQACLTGFIFRL
jgi:hypothetical protein